MAREMKDSGIEWIGEIPAGWESANIRKFFSFGKGLPITKEDLRENGSPVISYGQIHSKANNGITTKHELLRYVDIEYIDTNPESLVCNGDFVFADTSEDLEGCGNCVYIDTYDALFAGYHTIILRNKGNNDNRYFAFLFQSDAWRKQIRGRVSGVKVYSISQRILRGVSVLIPPSEEQNRITDYLSDKCNQIDLVIDQTRASIEEYKKLKQAVITQAVTKGIRPDRPMKDSGVRWIGEIPEDWNIIKGHRIIRNTQNGLTRRDLEQNKGQIVIKLKNISSDGDIDYSYINRIELSEDEQNKYGLDDGDFLFVRVNGSKGLVGKSAIFFSIGEPVAYNDHIIRVRLNNLVDIEYFQHYLQSLIGRIEIDLRTSTAAGQYTISGEGLRDILVVLPSLNEQKEIVEFANAKCLEIKKLIESKYELIKALDSYKKSLIYEYVTGKKEVPA